MAPLWPTAPSEGVAGGAFDEHRHEVADRGALEPLVGLVDRSLDGRWLQVREPGRQPADDLDDVAGLARSRICFQLHGSMICTGG